MPSSDLKKELKGLGADIANAFKSAKSSPEFKKLQHELLSSIKSVSSSLAKAAGAASKSAEAKKIKRRLTRVASIGKKEGMNQAQKAQAAASVQLRKARAALKKLHRKAR